MVISMMNIELKDCWGNKYMGELDLIDLRSFLS